MSQFLYKNKKAILLLGILLLLCGVVLAFSKWGIEPEETVAGFLCGLGFGVALISFGIKNPKKFKD
jgi:hypothetical protein